MIMPTNPVRIPVDKTQSTSKIVFSRQIIVNGGRNIFSAEPRTDDMRQMIDDVRRVGPTVKDQVTEHMKRVATDLQRDIDRRMLNAIRGIR